MEVVSIQRETRQAVRASSTPGGFKSIFIGMLCIETPGGESSLTEMGIFRRTEALVGLCGELFAEGQLVSLGYVAYVRVKESESESQTGGEKVKH